VSHQEVSHLLARILADDVTAVDKREQIRGQLGLPPISRQDQQIYHYNSDSYPYFLDMLNKFCSRNPKATLGYVVKCLKELDLNNAAGKLVHSVAVF
jgi:hypothetical protein